MKIGRCVVAAIAMSIVAVLQANAETWFDTGISGYTEWPSDGANMTVVGQGVWTNTQYAALDVEAHRLEITSSDEVPDGLEFEAATRRKLEVNDSAVLHAEVMFSQFSGLPAIVSDAKGAMVALAGENDAPAAYYGVVAAAEGDTNTWTRLEGATPDTNATVMANIAVTRTAANEYFVMYSIGETVLSSGGETNFPINVGEATTIKGAILRGRGSLSSLSADSTAEPLMAELTISPVENVSVESVTVAGTPVELTNGVYRVLAGSVVTVTFAPAAGYAFAIGSAAAVKELEVMEDTTLDSDLPSAVLVNGVVTINEVMASGTNTFRGVTGIDWVELKNNGDVDIDLTGWYLFDDPTKDQSKWIKIEGSCIVPAHDFKIVWADKSYEFAAGEAWTRIGLSSDGETVFLAGPDGTEVSRVEFPGLPKNMSYGVGRLVGAEEDSLVIFKEPTPEAANTTDGYGPMTPEVTFSVSHGWKTKAFDLELVCADDPDAAIYYTTNGTSPTTSSILYNPNEPIHISHTTCIRAAVPRADAYLQLDSSATYLFLADIKQQTRGVVPNGFPADRAVNNQSMLYGMKQDIVNGADSQRLEEGFTNSAFVATLSLVVDTNNLFAADSGIYVNGTKDGRDWERQTMVEQIDPVHGAANEFSIPAGLRIRGASSRGTGYPKHSLRLFFRSDYGKGSLDFKLFGDEGASSFEKVDLRTSQNHAWANGYDYAHSISRGDTFVHEVFSRDTQRDMGEPYARTRNYHLFINGQYWGMYQTEERGDEDYAASYNGGDKDNYDAIKSSQVNGSRVTGPTSGNADAWNAMWDMAVNQGFTGAYESNYMKIMGKNPDGTRNTEYPVYLDPTNLITYMLISHYVVDADTPASTWAAALPNNLVAFRDRVDDDKKLKRQGFMYLRHDCEHSMGVNPAPTPEVTNEVKTAYYTDPTIRGTELWSQAYSGNNSFNNKGSFNPAVLNYKLGFNTEYATLLGDLFYKHCLRPGGALTPDMAKARFASRTNEIDNAIVCEAARWGRTNKATRDGWLISCSNVVDFIDHRMPYMVAQYRNRGWYPSIDAPVAVDAATEGERLADGAVIPDGEKIYIESDNAVYYTTNGVDPRLVGGEVSPDALLYNAAEGITPVTGSFTLKIRAKSGSGEWSAMDEIPLKGDSPLSDQQLGIRIAAIMSVPLGNADGDGEFIVLTNSLDRAVSLNGLKVMSEKSTKTPVELFTVTNDVELAANGVVKLNRADYWPSGNLKNKDIVVEIYDVADLLVQRAVVDADLWFDGNKGVCKGTGAYFIALEFGDTVTEQSQWTYPSDQKLGVRVSAIMSAPKGDTDGDGEFIELTNVLNRAVSLNGLVVKSAKATKAVEPLFTVTNDVELSANGAMRFNRADYWPENSLKNKDVAVEIYDTAGMRAQRAVVDADLWFDGNAKVCKGTGAYFVALEFGENVTEQSQWTYFMPPAFEPISIEDGSAEYADATAATAATNTINNDKTTYISVPAEANVNRDTYNNYVKAVANGATVTIEFTTAADNPEVNGEAVATNKAESAVLVLPVAGITVVGEGYTTNATITASEPGFYYSIMTNTAPSGFTGEHEYGERQVGNGGEITLPVPYIGTKGFYKVKVSPRKNQ